MAIKPINLPSGAALSYGGGDVRHFGLGDAVDVVGMSTPTRNLADRDNLLAEKVNEVVSAVNNKEQFIPLPVIRTYVPPSTEIVVTNYRIPAGFEARVLNAVISTTPSSTSGELNVYYNSSFGGSTGAAVVTCTPGSEFTGAVNFYQTGEFVIAVKNTGQSSLEVAASVMLSMRPVGAVGSLLVGSVVAGPQGQPGMAGPPGPPGDPGTSGAGTPGMVWAGAWVNGVGYLPNEVASFAYSGTFGSFIARAAHTASLGVNDPSVDPVTWNPVAVGYGGSIVMSGTTVTVVNTSGSIPNYSFATVAGTLITGSDWVPGIYSKYYGLSFAASSTYTFNLREINIGSAAANPGYQRGVAFLSGVLPVSFSGHGTIRLPKHAYGASVDYSNVNVDVVANTTGTLPYTSSPVQIADAYPILSTTDSYVIVSSNGSPVNVCVELSGAQCY